MDLNSNEYADNAETLASALGADQTCVQSASSWFENESSGGGGFGISSSSNKSEGGSESYQSGCSSVFIDTKTIVDKTRRINCTLNVSATETDTKVQGNASITIKIHDPDNYQQTVADVYYAQLASHQELNNACIGLGATNPDAIAGCLSAISSLQPENILDTMGVLNINNSTLEAVVESMLEIKTEAKAEAAVNVKQDFTDIVSTAAENALEQTTGFQALNDNTKEVISQTVDTRSEEIDNTITKVLNSTNIEVKNSSTVEIIAPISINLDGATISSKIVLDVMASTLATAAIDLGKEVAAEVALTQQSNNTAISDAEGADAFASAVGDTGVQMTESQNEMAQSHSISSGIDSVGNAASNVIDSAGSAFSDIAGAIGSVMSGPIIMVCVIVIAIVFGLVTFLPRIIRSFRGGSKKSNLSSLDLGGAVKAAYTPPQEKAESAETPAL